MRERQERPEHQEQQLEHQEHQELAAMAFMATRREQVHINFQMGRIRDGRQRESDEHLTGMVLM